jgi:hypothetical protein
MDEPPQTNSPEGSSGIAAADAANSVDQSAIVAAYAQVHEKHQRAILRRVSILLAVAGVAFILTTWILVRRDSLGKSLAADSAPSQIVRHQLDALNRGELREAYGLFSQDYRKQVPFEAFHELVSSHWAMFRARTIDFDSLEETHVRAILDTHITTADGTRFVARYTLVEIEGQWWIDDVHWGREEEPRNRTTA